MPSIWNIGFRIFSCTIEGVRNKRVFPKAERKLIVTYG